MIAWDSKTQADFVYARHFEKVAQRVNIEGPIDFVLATYAIRYELQTEKPAVPSPERIMRALTIRHFRKRHVAIRRKYGDIVAKMVKRKMPLFAIVQLPWDEKREKADLASLVPDHVPSTNFDDDGGHVGVTKLGDALALQLAYDKVKIYELQPIVDAAKEHFGLDWAPI